MEAQALVLLLLALGLAALLVLLAIFLGSTRHSRCVPASPTATIEVSDPAIARTMLVDYADAFSNRPMAQFPKSFTGTHSNSINSVPYGPAWRALRGSLMAGILHPTRLGLLAPLQRRAVEALVAGLSSRGAGEVVVRGSLHAAVFGLAARLCFGDGLGDHEVRAMEHVLREVVFTFLDDGDLFAGSRLARLLHWRRWLRYSGIFSQLSKLILPAVAARQRSRPRNSGGAGDTTSDAGCYVDSLLDLRIPDSDDNGATTTGSKRPLSEKEMVRLVFEFLGTNTESIVSCVEWTLARLITHPTVQKKLHHEIVTSGKQGKGGALVSKERLRGLPYLRAVILESLRLHAPVPFILRDVAGHDAAAVCGATASTDGTPVSFVIRAREVGRNVKVWTDPDEFRPERFLPGGEAEGVGPVPGPKEIRMMPFGAGRRYCPGVDLGMVHVGCFLAALVREFEWALPEHGHTIDLSESTTFIMVMNTPLTARITPRA